MVQYEVWGRDTFACEDYLCGSYTNRETAERICAENEREAAKYQDAALRDNFWVVEITDKEKKKRKIQNEHIENEINKESFYSQEHLRIACKMLLEQFFKKLQKLDLKNHQKIRTDENFILITKDELKWDNPSDCFLHLQIELLYNVHNSGKHNKKSCYRINTIISFRSGKYYSGGDCSQFIASFNTVNDILEWFREKNTIELVINHYNHLINNFYKD